MNRTKLFTHNFISASLIQLGTSNCFYVLMAVIPLYAAGELGLSPSRIGLITGFFSITCVFLRPFAGAFIDGIGRLNVYRPALLFFSFCIAGHIAAAGFVPLLLLRMFQGAAWAFIGTAGPTVAADIVPPQRRAEGLAYYYLAMSSGMALGPAVGIIMLDFVSYTAVFISFAAVALFAWGATFLLKLPPFTPKKVLLNIHGLFEKKVLDIAFLMAFYGMAYGGVLTFAVLRGKQDGVPSAGLFYLFFAVTMAITRPIGGSLLDRNGPGNIPGFGFAMMMAGLLMLSFSGHFLLYFVSALILGIGAGAVLPPLAAMTINVVPPERRGAANATAFTALDVGTGFGAILLGVVADHFSVRFMYAASAFILVIPLIYYYAVFRGRYALLIVGQK